MKEDHNWKDIIAKYKASGLHKREFCELNGVPYRRLRYQWYKKEPADRVLNFNQDNIIKPARFKSIVIEPPAVIDSIA